MRKLLLGSLIWNPNWAWLLGMVKHIEGNLLRLITSCSGKAIERLSAFTEFYLKPPAQSFPSFVKDTTDLLNKVQLLNESGPFPRGTLLVSWDVEAMFPNIDKLGNYSC